MVIPWSATRRELNSRIPESQAVRGACLQRASAGPLDRRGSSGQMDLVPDASTDSRIPAVSPSWVQTRPLDASTDVVL